MRRYTIYNRLTAVAAGLCLCWLFMACGEDRGGDLPDDDPNHCVVTITLRTSRSVRPPQTKAGGMMTKADETTETDFWAKDEEYERDITNWLVVAYDENADFVLAHNMGPVRYWDESPVVFYNSRINLNFTIRNIRSGIPLRVWDILAAGGFCITNFQPELVMYFKNGEELVWFEDEADLVKKVGYYLSHEDERKRIALNGQKKVRELHNYDVRLRAIEEAITT